MKILKPILLLTTVFFLLIVAGCGSSFENLNKSEGGVMIEQLLPKDTWLMLSVTTKDEGQREAFNKFASEFSGEANFFESITQGFADIGMSYEEDIAPILGEDGFRFVMAYAGQDAYIAMTISDVGKTEAWLDAMVARGEAEVLALGDEDMYVSKMDGQESYVMIIEDVLMVAGSSEALLNAKGQLAADDAESLLGNDKYMTSMEEVETPYVGYVYVDFNEYESVMGAPFGAGSFMGMGSYLMDNQVWSVAFDDGQVLLSGYGDGDREVIDNIDMGLDDTQGESVYLAENVPADNLILYDESGQLGGLLDLWIRKGGQDLEATYASIDAVTTKFFSLNFKDEILTFLDKGYAVAVHDNGSAAMPAISLIIDVSSDLESAQEFITRLDSQVDSLVMMMQYDETGAWDSLSKTDTSVLGGDFHVVSMRMDQLASVYEAYVGGTPPADGEVLTLSYGITADDLLIISTYDKWELFDKGNSVADLPDFVEMRKAAKDYDDTVLYVDISEVAKYLDLMGSNVTPSVMLDGGVSSESTLQDYLKKFNTAMFGVKADRYKVWMKGIVR